jgi:hypothetical protein
VGAADRARIDEHLTSIGEVERLSQASAPGTSCAPVDPTSTDPDTAFLKLIALALRCDQTRYASFMLDTASGQRSYPGSPGGDHDLSHNATDDVIIRRTNIKLAYLAAFLRDLAATPEGSGTLLDNTIVYSCSDIVDGRTHGREPGASNAGMPVILAGRAGGALKAGRHVSYPRRRLSDLMCSLLNYGGVPSERYGSNGTGPLPGL